MYIYTEKYICIVAARKCGNASPPKSSSSNLGEIREVDIIVKCASLVLAAFE
jgi:hypothetical protein